jgi:hypothetical protein
MQKREKTANYGVDAAQGAGADAREHALPRASHGQPAQSLVAESRRGVARHPRARALERGPAHCRPGSGCPHGICHRR